MSHTAPAELINEDGSLNKELFKQAKAYCTDLSIFKSPITKMRMKLVLLELRLVEKRLDTDSTLPPEERASINALFQKALKALSVVAEQTKDGVRLKPIALTQSPQEVTAAAVEREVAAIEADILEMQTSLSLFESSHDQYAKTDMKRKIQENIALTPLEAKAQKAFVKNVQPALTNELRTKFKQKRASSGSVEDDGGKSRSSSGDVDVDSLKKEAADMKAHAKEAAQEHNKAIKGDTEKMQKMSKSLFGLAASELARNARKSISESMSGLAVKAKSAFGESAAQKREKEQAHKAAENEKTIDEIKKAMVGTSFERQSEKYKEKHAEITQEQLDAGYYVGLRSAGLTWDDYESLVIIDGLDGALVGKAFMKAVEEFKKEKGNKPTEADIKQILRDISRNPPTRPRSGSSNL